MEVDFLIMKPTLVMTRVCTAQGQRPMAIHTLVVFGRILRKPKYEFKFDDNLNAFERDILKYGSTSRSLFFLYVSSRSK